MRIFALYPAFDPSMDEMAMVWGHLCRLGRVQLSVVALQASRLKAHVSPEVSEDFSNLKIRRYPSLRLSEPVISFARQSEPDLIFCAVDINLPLALQLAKMLDRPVMLHTEYFFDDVMIVRRRRYLGLPFLRPLAAQAHRERLLRQTVRILTSDPADVRDPAKAGHPQLAYLPWPHVGDSAMVPLSTRDRNFSTYIGSLQRGKGAETLHRYYSALLAHEREFRLTLVGPPIDQAGRALVQGLLSGFPSQCTWIDRCSRDEARALISKSCFILSPGRKMGWGLIADAWSSGTPVIAAAAHYDLVPDHNCLIAPDVASFLHCVERLRGTPAVWEQLSVNGVDTSRTHSVESVADVLWNQLRDTAALRAGNAMP
jgi:glycosyltransferase involved in cell wall biosynthesis